MQTEFTNWIQKKYTLTGVYIAVHDIPCKVPDEDDDDAMAHFDVKRDTCLTYIACSKDHQFLKGKELPKEATITYTLFPEGGAVKEEEPEAEPEEGGDKLKKKKRNYVYIEDVIKNKKLFYFRIARLGSYIAIPMNASTCLHN